MAKEMRLVLRNIDKINPHSIDEYIAVNGYKGLEKALKMQPQKIIDAIKESGMRGRGGAGFSTGRKWEFVAGAEDDQKYIICNADEGDPGAFMDRQILEGDPHSIIEAMVIAGYAVGANKGYVYVRAEYPVAVDNIKIAINHAKERGFLGKDILGSGFAFDIDVRLGAGAYVCGEETALIASIEGKRGEPRPRPPFPATRGLWDKPTLINNVETLSAMPMIIFKGPTYWNKIGSENNSGTKVFALAGNVVNGGLVEVPMGVTINELVYEIGGGIPNGKKAKAVQTGGPSGGCIPASGFDMKLDFDSLQKAGSILGSGGVVVMDENTCMVDVAKYFTQFSVDESCGKCTPCRVGNKKILGILEKITSGRGEENDLNELEKLSKVITDASLCGLGQSACNPVMSTVRYFRDEYLEHIKGKKCLAGVCSNLCNFEINEKCIMCTACVKICPVNAIEGEIKKPHTLHKDICIKCGVCVPVCPVGAIVKT